MTSTTQTEQSENDNKVKTVQIQEGEIEINLAAKTAVKHSRELQMVDDKLPEDDPSITNPYNYSENYEEVEKTEEKSIENKGIREINQFTKFKEYSRSRDSPISSELECKSLYLIKIKNGDTEVIRLDTLMPAAQKRGIIKSEYHDLREDGIKKKVNWSKNGGRGHESGSGSNYLIYREAIQDCDQAFMLKQHHEQGGSENGSYEYDSFKVWELKEEEE